MPMACHWDENRFADPKSSGRHRLQADLQEDQSGSSTTRRSHIRMCRERKVIGKEKVDWDKIM